MTSPDGGRASNEANERRAIAEGGPLRAHGPARTLVEALAESARRPSPAGVVSIAPGGAAAEMTYAELQETARKRLSGLRAAGVQPGRPVLVQLESPAEFLPTLWACILGGVVPAPLPIAPSLKLPGAAAERFLGIWRFLEMPFILSSGPVAAALRELAESSREDLRILDVDALEGHEPGEVHRSSPSDAAIVLFTSGSTGTPKGVVLSHENLLSMAAGTIQANGFTPRDVTLNWLPLDHVGAVSFLHLMAVYLGCRQVHAPTRWILPDVFRWLELADRERATITWAPDFAFRLIADRAHEVARRGWDLSSIRFLVDAGEAISPDSIRRFRTACAPAGLDPGAIRPAFGMSETCSGITWADRECLREGRDGEAYVELGPPIPGAKIRIVGPDGETAREGEVGRLEVSGPSVTKGYWNAPEINRQVFRGGWFNTGDLGVIREGRLSIAGREKDVIILAGVHYASHEIERVVETVPGVETSYVAAVGVRAASGGPEELAVFFAPSSPEAAAWTELSTRIRRTVAERTGANPRHVLPLEKEAFPKTSIGKIERSKLKRMFEAGELGPVSSPPPSAAPPRAEAVARAAGDVERGVQRVWREVLQLERIDLDANFFDLGGTSVLLAQIQGKLEEGFGVSLTPADLLAYPSARAQARLIAERTGPAAVVQESATPPRAGEAAADEPLAIVGMACRFPGAADVQAFWSNLRSGVDGVRTLSREELLEAGVAPERIDDPGYIPALPYLEGIEDFDAAFFGVSDRDAALMDPQHRLFLECAWEALEDAGIDPARTRGRIGVFASCGLNAYMTEAASEPDLEGDFEALLAAGASDFLSTRTSYKLDLRGPSMTVLTACSSGLVAAHLAAASLLDGESDAAIVGASSLWILGKRGYVHHEGGLTSKSGRCRAFSADADGMIFGNGVGAVVLKRLRDAVADGDQVHAVLRSTALNNDGSEKAGFLATGMHGQAAVVGEAIDRSGVAADSIGFIECHGTGTVLGDAIELSGLAKAFAPRTARRNFCAIGSVKSNIGHMGVACGIAGLIKAALAVREGEIPPTLHYRRPNPQVDLSRTPFFVNTRLEPWPALSGPRRAGVSSFGLGGTNAHAILEEPPRLPRSPSSRSAHVLPLSARTPAALESAAKRVADFLESHPQVELADVAYTLQLGRRAFPFRLAVVAGDPVEAAQRFRAESSRAKDLIEPDERAAFEEISADAAARWSAEALATRWVQGATVDWSGLYRSETRRKLSLPTYPFQRRRYWLPTGRGRQRAACAALAPAAAPAAGNHEPKTDPSTPGMEAVLAAPGDLVQRRRAMTDFLRSEVARLLGLSGGRDVPPRTGFLDLGMTSVRAVELIARLEGALGIELSRTLCFEYPNAASLAERLVELSADVTAARPVGQDRLERIIEEVRGMTDAEILSELRGSLSPSPSSSSTS